MSIGVIHHRLLSGVMASLLACSLPAGARGADTPSESDVKAAYLYNFAKFVQWPQTAMPAEGAPFCIGVLGVDPFSGGLDNVLANKTIQGHPLIVRYLKSPEEASHCQVVFINAADSDAEKKILDVLRAAPVLTVGDGKYFLRNGGIVGFQRVEDRIRFSVNVKAAGTAGLKPSSDLLKVAYAVRGAPGTERP